VTHETLILSKDQQTADNMSTTALQEFNHELRELIHNGPTVVPDFSNAWGTQLAQRVQRLRSRIAPNVLLKFREFARSRASSKEVIQHDMRQHPLPAELERFDSRWPFLRFGNLGTTWPSEGARARNCTWTCMMMRNYPPQ
jgi:hypothetical protein